MASLAKRRKGWRILVVDADGRRKTLRLPRGLNKKAAQAVKVKVEALLAARLAGTPLSQDVAGWLGSISDELHERLCKAGLVLPRQRLTLGDFLNRWLEERQASKPSSLAVYKQVIANLREHFGESLPLAALSMEHGRQFVEYLCNHGYRSTTIGKRFGCAKTILNRAVELGLLDRNPFVKVKLPAANPAERKTYVPVEVVEQALEACPKIYWRLLLVLGSY